MTLSTIDKYNSPQFNQEIKPEDQHSENSEPSKPNMMNLKLPDPQEPNFSFQDSYDSKMSRQSYHSKRA
jgi:hypothetical protein